MPFVPYNDYSDFSFYKPEITNFGIQALIIFSDNGLPIFSRFYDSSITTHNDNDILIITAFISSISNYILNYTDEFFTDFGIGISRYYLKFIDEKIYCIVLNEIVTNRITGESLVVLMVMTLNQLIKSFTVFYKMTATKKLTEMNYLERFIFQIDTILFFNFKNAVTELDSLVGTQKHEFDNFKIAYANSDLYNSINHQMMIKGIKGLIIFDKDNNPLIIRDYALEKNYQENIDHYSSITMAIKKFADFNLGVVRDIGLGNTRVLVKQKKNELTICLFISGILYWRINGEILTMFLELTLRDILRSFTSYLQLFHYETAVGLDDETKIVLNEQIDLLLLENSKVALQELNY